MKYLPVSEADRAEMLRAIGAPSVEALFNVIPKEVREDPKLPPPLSEIEVRRLMGGLSARNASARETAFFLGAGLYNHYVSAISDQMLYRSEWLTSYTPYQPEVSQGTLQSVFEFQTHMCLLTGLDVANASMYDGATAAAEAALLCSRVHADRSAIVLSRALHPSYRQVVRAYLEPTGIEVREVPFRPDGRTDLESARKALDGAAGLIVGYPNFFGVIEPLKEFSALCRDRGALLATATLEPLAFGLLAAPGSLGADLAVGELQSFGNGLNFGGPGLGFFAARDTVLRQMPGRLCGATLDRKGRRGFVLTLSTREQHIKRERATSNICTNHALNALAATIHLSLLGRPGLQALARLNWQRARYARAELQKAGLSPLFTGPTFNEFAVRADVRKARAGMAAAGIDGGYALAQDYPELEGGLLFCVTELHSRAAIDHLAAALRAKP